MSTRHESAHLHVSGRALYADDIPLPANTLHGAFGMSSIAHGWIRAMDLGAVMEFPGVVAVARQYFQVPADDERLSVEIGEGGAWVAAHPACCDVLMVDGYDGIEQVSEICSADFYANAHAALSDDGVLVVPRARIDEALSASLARVNKEEANRKRFAAGELGLDVYGMRDKLAAKGIRYYDDARALADGAAS